jgi:hypothetical protein
MRPPPAPHEDTTDFAAANPVQPCTRGQKRKRRVAVVDPHRYDWLDKHLSSCGKEMKYNVGLRNSSWCDTGKQQYKAWTWEAKAGKRQGRVRKQMLNPEVPTRRSPRTGATPDCSTPLMSKKQVEMSCEDFEIGPEPSTPKPSAALETPSQVAAAVKPDVKKERKKVKRWMQHTFEGMGMPSRLKGTGVDQWMGKGGVVAAIIAHLGITMKAEHALKVLERAHNAFLEGKLSAFDAGAADLTDLSAPFYHITTCCAPHQHRNIKRPIVFYFIY